MRRRLPSSSNLTNLPAVAGDPTSTAILEFLSPSETIAATPIPRAARGLVWIVGTMFALWVAALGLISVDRVVTGSGRVVSQAATMVVQPLETSIVRSINVREGQQVQAGDLLARLDPTFSAADVDALQVQVSSMQAEVSRLQAELDGKPFEYAGSDPWMSLQAALYAQRDSERRLKLEYYRQKIDGLKSTASRAAADAVAFRERLAVAQAVEQMRKELEQRQTGSRLNLLASIDNRLEIERSLSTSVQNGETAKADLAAMIAERDGYVQTWRSQVAQTLSEESRKLSDARESLNKALLRRKLVELRAERDATVLTIAKVSEGSVLQPGEQLITLVPADAPLEIEANISGRDHGFLHVGDPTVIKFDTFPFSQYGMAYGTVRVISADSFTAADQQASHTAGAVPVPQSNTEPFYRARISIDRLGLHDVPETFRVAPGMPVTADIKVGEHTVLGYLLGRVLSVASEAMREP
jgi:hemolysin D